MSDEKRIKDFEPAAEILVDDWFAVDSPSQGTRKIQTSMFQAGLQSQITANRDDIDLHSGQISTLQLGVSNIGDKVDVLDSAVTTDDYSASSTYAVGDYCIYEDVMYKCTTAISTPEAFNPSHWTATSIENEINELNSNLAKVKFTKFTYNYDSATISANSSLTFNPTNSKPSNLTHIAMEYFNSGHANAFFRYINGGTGAVNIRNNSSSSITITPALVITCVDSSLVN